jgi:hypothetical protein
MSQWLGWYCTRKLTYHVLSQVELFNNVLRIA